MSLFSISQFPLTAALLLLIAGRRLEAKSIIVDDSDTSRIIYSSGWSAGNNCSGCFAALDATQPSNGTWHDGTASSLFTPFFTFEFTGTSVEARYIAIDIIQTAFTFTTGTNASYSIDGVKLGTTVRNPVSRGAYVYNQTLFNVEGLSNGSHILRVELLRPSVLLLDCLVYDDGIAVPSSSATSALSTTSSAVSSTVNDPSPPPKTNTGAIVGGVVAAVLVLVLGAALLWYFRRRRREISRRNRPPVLASAPNSPVSGAHPNMQMATAQGALSSHFSPPSDVTPVPYIPPQPDRTPAPRRVGSTHKAIYNSARSESNPSGSSYAPSDTLTSSTIPPIPSASANPRSTPFGPDAQRDSRVNEKSSHGWMVQNLTSPGPLSSSFHSNAAADSEPVEAGLMSRHMSTRSALPLYSPGGFQHDEKAPPLPGR